MKRKTHLIASTVVIILSSFCLRVKAQSLPAGTAGIVYTYDAAGNRTKSQYVLNNTAATANIVDSQQIVARQSVNVLKVDALYPNPTTGQITVTLVKPLNNGVAEIMDISGRVLLRSTETGNTLHFDLSRMPTGVYFLHLQQENQMITMKILKQ